MMINNKTQFILSALGTLIIAALAISFFKAPMLVHNECLVLHSLNELPKSTSQVLLVKSSGGFKANIVSCALQQKRWQKVLTQKSFPAVIGKAGLAPEGQKKEGDLKTPVGLYSFGNGFGTKPLALKMDYKYITAEDKFIDDVNSTLYNSWVIGETDAKSFETMLIDPYKMGIVINYNMNPVIKGAGSAIFMHLWKSNESPTAGCIATDEQSLHTILEWLDKAQHPYIYIMN